MKELLNEVSTWKLEAKLENSKKYFYHIEEACRVEGGGKAYVIGRKGTGKTAIAEHLFCLKDHDTFTVKLSFKNFPFNQLYKLKNDDFNNPNQYITLWKYLIYSSLAKMMIDNKKIDLEIRSKLEQIYTKEPIKSLPNTIKKWVGSTLKLSFLGTGLEIGTINNNEKNETEWIDRTNVLEEIIEKYIDKSRYYIIFDELDEDYRDILISKKHQQYTDLLTSLFKSVQDIKSTFIDDNYNIFPVIFLRDDIYEIIQDPDKNKWNDLKLDLDWNETKIKTLLQFRLSRAINPEGNILEFGKAWGNMFVQKDVSYGHRQQKKMSSFNYISRSTLGRPRDYIRYLQLCAELSILKGKNKVLPSIIIESDKAFSNYLKNELVDEIHGAVPEIQDIFNIISHIRKQTFSIEEFKTAYDMSVKRGEVTDRGVEFILRILFHFSVIGNQPKQKNIQVFRYINKEARFNFSENVIVHRGLFKALQIL